MAATVIESINIGAIDTTPRGITFDGKDLWWIGATNKKINHMDRSGKLIEQFAIGAIDTGSRGITFDGKDLWWTGNQHTSIYHMTRS